MQGGYRRGATNGGGAMSCYYEQGAAQEEEIGVRHKRNEDRLWGVRVRLMKGHISPFRVIIISYGLHQANNVVHKAIA